MSAAMAQCVAGPAGLHARLASRSRTPAAPAARPILPGSTLPRYPCAPCPRRAVTLAAMDPAAASHAVAAFDLAALDSATAGLLSAVLRPVLSLSSLLMIVRIVMTWYPEVDATQMPWSIAYTPTEPLLSATRKVVKPFNGLDVSPIVWVALLSFMSEILTGPQGILSLIERKGI